MAILTTLYNRAYTARSVTERWAAHNSRQSAIVAQALAEQPTAKRATIENDPAELASLHRQAVTLAFASNTTPPEDTTAQYATPNFRRELVLAAAEMVQEHKACIRHGNLGDRTEHVEVAGVWQLVGRSALTSKQATLEKLVQIAFERTEALIKATRQARRQQRRAA